MNKSWYYRTAPKRLEDAIYLALTNDHDVPYRQKTNHVRGAVRDYVAQIFQKRVLKEPVLDKVYMELFKELFGEG